MTSDKDYTKKFQENLIKSFERTINSRGSEDFSEHAHTLLSDVNNLILSAPGDNNRAFVYKNISDIVCIAEVEYKYCSLEDALCLLPDSWDFSLAELVEIFIAVNISNLNVGIQFKPLDSTSSTRTRSLEFDFFECFAQIFGSDKEKFFSLIRAFNRIEPKNVVFKEKEVKEFCVDNKDYEDYLERYFADYPFRSFNKNGLNSRERTKLFCIFLVEQAFASNYSPDVPLDIFLDINFPYVYIDNRHRCHSNSFYLDLFYKLAPQELLTSANTYLQ